MTAPDSQNFLRELDKKLWTAADRLRSNLDAAVYKHAVLGQFALAEEKSRGLWTRTTKILPEVSPKGWRECANQLFTPKSIASLIAEMIVPYQRRVYDPAMGSSGFLISSERFIEEPGEKLGILSVYAQESKPTNRTQPFVRTLRETCQTIRGANRRKHRAVPNSFSIARLSSSEWLAGDGTMNFK